ncbi:universal stress protein [Crenalkalicoccus roseus]|uniref:universal stress protein n=1 Tax=Crenalkalicoccus roseus TaxID=1485588 RepID=UPI0010806C5E|nr:universal stress protein [Crenalkalicoccus roseus]
MRGIVLVLLERPDRADSLLAAAGRLAELLGGARIDALAVRVPPETTILPSEEVMTREHHDRIVAREQARMAALRRSFEPWALRVSAGGMPASWCEVEGLADAVVEEWGRAADVLVLPRPDEHDGPEARQAIHAALFRTDRPGLLVPPGFTGPFGRRVAIAWREDRCATRAVLSALRCRLPPEAVHVITGLRAGAPPPRIPAILEEHEVEAELHVLPIGPGVFGEALLAKAHALGADMLVMGAYLHSPLRELVLGGVTRWMLAHADLPVLMRH